jgi:hypothetical protein
MYVSVVPIRKSMATWTPALDRVHQAIHLLNVSCEVHPHQHNSETTMHESDHSSKMCRCQQAIKFIKVIAGEDFLFAASNKSLQIPFLPPPAWTDIAPFQEIKHPFLGVLMPEAIKRLPSTGGPRIGHERNLDNKML